MHQRCPPTTAPLVQSRLYQSLNLPAKGYVVGQLRVGDMEGVADRVDVEAVEASEEGAHLGLLHLLLVEDRN